MVQLTKLNTENNFFMLSNETETYCIYDVYKILDDEKILIHTNSLDSGKSTTLKLEDGIYLFLVKSNGNQVVLEQELTTTDNLLEYIKDGVENICFDCCGDNKKKKKKCDDGCSDVNKEMVNLILAVQHYYSYDYEIYNPIREILSKKLKMDLNPLINTYVNRMKIIGTSTLEGYYEKVILMYYAVFIFGEMLAMNADIEAVKEKYEYARYKECFKKFNIIFEEYIDMLTAMSRVYTWQEGYNYDMDSLVEAVNEKLYLEKPNKSYSFYSNGETVILNQTGKLIFVISYANSNGYKIIDSLGNNVTQAFEKVILEDKGIAIYLSKTHYVNSEIYFKFVKL